MLLYLDLQFLKLILTAGTESAYQKLHGDSEGNNTPNAWHIDQLAY